MRKIVAFALFAFILSEMVVAAPTAADACLEKITAAVGVVETRLPELTAQAEEAARRIARNPYASIECPRKGQWGFAEEFWERAGGLSQFADGAFDTPDNVVLLSSRVPMPTEPKGKLIVRFSPVTGDPGVDLAADLVSGWAWCCEYASAMTRLCGRFPAITETLGANDSWIVNCGGWSPDHLPRLLPCPERIPAGRLGGEYLAKTKAMLAAMKDAPTRDAVAAAARYIGGELEAGRTVGVAGLGHPIIEECTAHLKSGMKGVCVVGNIPKAYTEALSPGDTLVWIAYNGLDTYWADYGTPMREAGLNLVLSHSDGTEPARGDYVKAFIPQLWKMPDAEVRIPVRPFAMAPLSEVSRCTLLRMFDAEVAVRHPRGKNPPPNYGTAFFEKMEFAAKTPPPASARRMWTRHGFTFEMDENHRWSLKGKTPYAYDMLRPLSPKLIAYERDRRYGLMSPDGRELTSAKWDLVAPYGLFGMAETDFAVFAERGKYGKMDPVDGSIIAPATRERYPLTASEEVARSSVPSPSQCVRAVPTGASPDSRLWQRISPKVKEWEMRTRAETLRWFEENQFGRTPEKALDIAAREAKFEKNAVVFPKAGIRINVFCARPKGADARHPAPVFLFMDHRGGERAPDYPQEEYGGIPTNAITARGYAYVRWNGNDVCPNSSRYTGTLRRWPVGIVSYAATGDAAATNVTRAADGWGTIGAWAWGNSRVLDWIATQPDLDATRVCVLGHSRGGKTALWTAAQDERFAMAIANGSGCGGAGQARERVRDPKAEKFRDILGNFPNWFCPAFTNWIGREATVPHDSDDLIRLIAPRLVYVASGSEDVWACPRSENAAWDAAHDLYSAYGVAERMGYHCHEGGHFLRPDDWESFMNFADRNLKAPSAADSDEIDRRIAAAVKDRSRTVTLGRNAASADGAWRLVRAIRIPDDFTLVLDGCRVELADRVQDNLIRNAGAVEGVPQPNSGIRILGRNGATLSAGERNNFRPRRSGDPNGWRSVGILLCDVSDYEIGGLRFGETQCWAISQERCHHGRVHDIVFGSTDRFCNQDGVDVRKGCHDLVIEDISGSTGDDAVALTALRTPADWIRHGMQIGGTASLGEADDVYNVTVRNVRAKSAGGHGVVRLLAADGIRMHHIVVTNVVDTASGKDKRPYATIRIGDMNYATIRRCGMGEMHHVTVRDVKASGPIAVSISGPLADSSVTDIVPAPGGRRYAITAPIERVTTE